MITSKFHNDSRIVRLITDAQILLNHAYLTFQPDSVDAHKIGEAVGLLSEVKYAISHRQKE